MLTNTTVYNLMPSILGRVIAVLSERSWTLEALLERTVWNDQLCARGAHLRSSHNEELSGPHHTQWVLIIIVCPFHLRTCQKSLGARHAVSLLLYLFVLPLKKSHHIQASKPQWFPEHTILPEKETCHADVIETIIMPTYHIVCPLFPTLTTASTITICVCVLHYLFKIAFPNRFASEFFMRYEHKIHLWNW